MRRVLFTLLLICYPSSIGFSFEEPYYKGNFHEISILLSKNFVELFYSTCLNLSSNLFEELSFLFLFLSPWLDFSRSPRRFASITDGIATLLGVFCRWASNSRTFTLCYIDNLLRVRSLYSTDYLCQALSPVFLELCERSCRPLSPIEPSLNHCEVIISHFVALVKRFLQRFLRILYLLP